MSNIELPPPTFGEIGRAVLDLKQDVTELRRDLAETYVRQDVWQRAEEAAGLRVGELNRDIGDIKSDVTELRGMREGDRRLLWTAILGPILSGVIVGVILVTIRSGHQAAAMFLQ